MPENIATAKQCKRFRDYLLHYHAITMIAIESELVSGQDETLLTRIDALLDTIETPDLIKQMDIPDLKIMYLVSKLPTIMAALTSFILEFGLETLDASTTVQQITDDIYIFKVVIDNDHIIHIPFRNYVSTKPGIQH